MYGDAIGDSEAVAEQLRRCFTDDAVAGFEFPPAWAYLNVTVTGGPQAFGPFAVQWMFPINDTNLAIFYQRLCHIYDTGRR